VAENQPETKNRMNSELSIFAARLRDFIDICATEPSFAARAVEPAVQEYFNIQFNGMALVLFALQFNHNPAYRKFCEARKIFPNAIANWKEIPAAPTAAFKEMEFSCLAPAERTFVFHSSGTTEQRPSRHFHNAESLALYEAALQGWFQEHLFGDLKFETSNFKSVSESQSEIAKFKFAILTPPPASAPHSSLVHMFETVRRNFSIPESAFVGRLDSDASWNVDFAAAISIMRNAVETNRPLVLLGTAFSFVHLLDHLAEENLKFELPPGSRVMETGGYKGRSRSLPKTELHLLITEKLAIPNDKIVSENGMSELSSQSYDLPISTQNSKLKTRNLLFPPWARVQIVSPETGREVAEGETGLLRIFDLANVFSVMAIQTEDLAVRRGEGFELIGRAELSEPRGCSLMTNDAKIVNRKS
jgi:hypothetical protein